VKASRPPAEAPTPTTGNALFFEETRRAGVFGGGRRTGVFFATEGFHYTIQRFRDQARVRKFLQGVVSETKSPSRVSV